MADRSDPPGSKHGADAHIPSETEQFDRMSEQQEITPEQKELANEVRRLTQYSNYLLQHDQAGMMLIDAHVHKALLRAELMALSKLVTKKLGVSESEFTKAIIQEIQQELLLRQMDHRIIITPEGCIGDPQL